MSNELMNIGFSMLARCSERQRTRRHGDGKTDTADTGTEKSSQTEGRT